MWVEVSTYFWPYMYMCIYAVYQAEILVGGGEFTDVVVVSCSCNKVSLKAMFYLIVNIDRCVHR